MTAPKGQDAQPSASVDDSEAARSSPNDSGSGDTAAADSRATGSDRGLSPNTRFLLVLIVLAVVSRLVWVLWVHPPGDYVFSDMRKYVLRAQELAEHGFRPGVRTLAWQAWGTHTILALPLWLFGKSNYTAAAVLWGLMGAGAVVLGYLLACRVCSRAWLPELVGIALLLWYPNLSNSGYFLSETPFLFFQLWSTYWLVVLLQDGRRALGAGLVSMVAFAVRPQSALFYLLVLVTWLANRRYLRHVLPRHLVAVAIPLVLMLGFSLWRFHAHTGYWAGVAENANMNLTAGRCHNIVTQAFRNEALKRRSERVGSTTDGRRVSLPAFRMLARKIPPDHPLALRPAFESETIRFVGYVGDPDIHRQIRQECYRRTGTLEQARYSIVNISLLWFVGHQWPEMEKGRKYFFPYAEAYKHVYQVGIWLPSLLGLVLALSWVYRRPYSPDHPRRLGLTFCAWQLVTSMTVAAIFFGTIRLRTPYDPYAIILAAEAWAVAIAWVWTRRRRSRPTHEHGAPKGGDAGSPGRSEA